MIFKPDLKSQSRDWEREMCMTVMAWRKVTEQNIRST